MRIHIKRCFNPAGRIKSRIEKMAFPVVMPEESVRKIISEQENEEILKMLAQ
jgi:DNA replication protein DnaC